MRNAQTVKAVTLMGAPSLGELAPTARSPRRADRPGHAGRGAESGGRCTQEKTPSRWEVPRVVHEARIAGVRGDEITLLPRSGSAMRWADPYSHLASGGVVFSLKRQWVKKESNQVSNFHAALISRDQPRVGSHRHGTLSSLSPVESAVTADECGS